MAEPPSSRLECGVHAARQTVNEMLYRQSTGSILKCLLLQ